jgi:hypothetical protein
MLIEYEYNHKSTALVLKVLIVGTTNELSALNINEVVKLCV